MADNDVAAGKSPRQVDDVRHLRMEPPRIQRQPQRRQPRHPGAEIRTQIKPRLDVRRAVADHRIGVIPGRVAHATEPAAAGADMRLQHRRHPVAGGQIGVADDAGGDPASCRSRRCRSSRRCRRRIRSPQPDASAPGRRRDTSSGTAETRCRRCCGRSRSRRGIRRAGSGTPAPPTTSPRAPPVRCHRW